MGLQIFGKPLIWQTGIDNTRLQRDAAKTTGIFKKMGSTISGTLFAGVGVASALAIKEIIKVNANFEKSLSTLSSLTGAVGEDLEFYKQKAIEFGESTTQSASQVAEAFKLIGSQKPELLGTKEALASVTREAITLAEAGQIDVPVAAKALTNSLNQMSAGAEESAKYINILAAGSQKGAGDIPYLNSAIEKAGKVAHDSNLSFAELVAGIEALAPAFSEPSSAGLHFKAVLLRLQKNGYGFQSGMFDLQDALNEVKNELDNISDPAERASKEMDIFGTRTITAGKVLLESRNKYKQFAQTISGTNTAFEQAKTNTDNVEGAYIQLKSAIEGAILKNSDFNDSLKGLIQTLTEVVTWLGNNWDIIQKLAETYLIYKGTIVALSLAQRTYNTIVKLGTLLQGGLNKAMKANTIGLIVAGIYAAVQAFKHFNKANEEAKNSLIDVNQIGKDYQKTISGVIAKSNTLFDELKNAKKGTKEYDRALKKVNETYKDYLPNLLTNASSLDEIKKAQKAVNDELTRNIAIESQRQEIIKLTENYFKSTRSAFEEYKKLNTDNTAITFDWIKASIKAGVSIQSMADAIQKATGYGVRFGTLRNVVEIIKQSNKEFEEGKKSIEDYYNSIIKGLNIKPPEIKTEPEGGTGNGNKSNKEKELKDLFALQQEYELSRYKLLTQNKDQINTFQKQQEIDAINHKLETDNTLLDIERKTLENKKELLRQEIQAINDKTWAVQEITYEARLKEFDLMQENELAKFKLVATNEEQITLFKKKQQIQRLQYEIDYNKNLTALQKDTYEQTIKFLKKEIEMQNKMFKTGEVATLVFQELGKVIEKSFERSEDSAENFAEVLRESTIQVLSFLIGQAVAYAAKDAFAKFGIAGAVAAPVFAGIAKAAMEAIIPRFAEGGIVGGTGNKDNQLILAKPNEVILNERQQANVLMQIANGINGSNTEKLLREQNELLRNNKTAVIKDNVLYVVKNGSITGEKVYLDD